MIHVLRTRSPVYSPLRAFSLDLHVLGTPPAFVLSQDQTLQLSIGVSFLAHLHPTSAKRGREVHSKHCEFRNPSSWTCYPVFRDRPDTSFPLRTSDDSASRRVQHPGEGRASYRCQLLRVKDLASVPARTPRLQGSRGVADRSRAVNFPGQFASNLARRLQIPPPLGGFAGAVAFFRPCPTRWTSLLPRATEDSGLTTLA